MSILVMIIIITKVRDGASEEEIFGRSKKTTRSPAKHAKDEVKHFQYLSGIQLSVMQFFG